MTITEPFVGTLIRAGWEETQALGEDRAFVVRIRLDGPVSWPMQAVWQAWPVTVSRAEASSPTPDGVIKERDGRRPDGPGLSHSVSSPSGSPAAAASIPGAEAGPSPGLLMSMAMRSDHAIAHEGYYDWETLPGFGKRIPGKHAKRLAATMSSMRQLWEEVAGCGFYAPHKESDYADLAASLGVTFTENGYPVAERARNEQPKAENPKGLSPQAARPVTEGEAPASTVQPPSSQESGVGETEGSKVIAWLERQIETSHRDADNHPEGSGNRSFYRGQAIAYENALSLVQDAAPRPSQREG